MTETGSRRGGGRARRAARRAALGAVGLVVVVGTIAAPGPSGAASTFTAAAGGEVVRPLLRLQPALLAEELLDPGALTAQARLTSFGESTAFASHPYPGAVPVSLPGLIDGLAGMSLPPELAPILNVPEYPLIASSTHPATPSSTLSIGPLTLDAQSRQRESSATTTDGVNRTEARVAADEVTDVVSARASTTVGIVDLGPLVQLGGIRSTAEVTRDADGEVDRATEFTVASLSVLGTQLQVTRTGIELAGVNLPPGLGGVLDPVQQLLASLQERGTSIRFVDATETEDGVVSAGLVVESRFDTGINGIIGTVSLTLGRTFASVSNTARGGLGDDVDLEPSGSVELPGSGIGTGSGAPFPSGTPELPRSGTGTPSGSGAVGATERILALEPDRTDAGAFYPVLAAGGVVFVIGISLFRKIGVRSPWT